MQKIGNGFLVLPLLNGKFFKVYGGPYRQRPESLCGPLYLQGVPVAGVKLAQEIEAACDVDIKILDFSIPTDEQLDRGLLQIVQLIADRKPVYIGCMGGIGRTGLILALLAKAWGIEDPITYVRSNYIPHAVETREQINLVDRYEIQPDVLRRIKWAKFRSLWWSRSKCLTRGA